MTRWIKITIWSVAVMATLFLGVMNLVFGELNQDEGWYLYAASEVAHGRFPHRDFAFTQGPVMPVIYAAFNPLVKWQGVGAGRMVTLMLGLVAALMAARMAARWAPRGWGGAAGMLCFILAAVNVYQSYFTTVVKTYSLAAVLLTGGFLALSRVRTPERWPYAALASVLFVLAAGTRLSAGLAIPAAAWFLYQNRSVLGSGCGLTFATSFCIASGVVFLPGLAANPAGFIFGMFQYHAGRETGSFLQWLVNKVGFASRVCQAYYLALALGVVALLRRKLFGAVTTKDVKSVRGFGRCVMTSVGLITLLHFAAPFPYDDYQVFIYPIFCASVAVGIICIVAATGNTQRLAQTIVLITLTLSLASSFSSPINQSWVIAGRDRIWWKLRDKPALLKLREAARFLREQKDRHDVLLTQDLYLAVESGMRVPPGLEMGPFSYYPDWPRERAEQVHVLNRDMMWLLICQNEATFAAFSGYGLAIQSPQVTPLPADEQTNLLHLVTERYDEVQRYEAFGQAETTLRIYRWKGKSIPVNIPPEREDTRPQRRGQPNPIRLLMPGLSNPQG